MSAPTRGTPPDIRPTADPAPTTSDRHATSTTTNAPYTSTPSSSSSPYTDHRPGLTNPLSVTRSPLRASRRTLPGEFSTTHGERSSFGAHDDDEESRHGHAGGHDDGTKHVDDVTAAMRHATLDGTGTAQAPLPDVPMQNPYGDKYPHPSLAPEDVIEIQLGAMKYNELPVPDGGIEICFRFASPANRMYTGPLTRFVRMLHNPLYECMLNYDSLKFTPANTAGTKWRLAITKAGATLVFVWSLSKQLMPPYANCWLTDNVILVQE